jgi:osmotically-inducible protein OsmY
MSNRCTMSRIRWISGPSIVALALLGIACRSESERAEGTVREEAGEARDRGVASGEQGQRLGESAREQAEKVKQEAGQLAREGQELGDQARQQADKVKGQAEQLAQQGRELAGQANEKMNQAGEQTGALKDQGGAAREQAAQPRAAGQQPTQKDQKDQAAQKDQASPQSERATHPRAAGQQPTQKDQAAQKDQASPQSEQARGQAGGEKDKGQAGDTAASQREAWIQVAKDNDFEVNFNRDGSVMATKEASGKGTPKSDDALRNEVAGKLAESDHEGVKKLDVSVRNGIVTLTGNVSSMKEATEALKAAMSAEGVTQVISRVRPAP